MGNVVKELEMGKQKLKSHKGAAKRFKITGSGKIKRWRACASHLLEKKSKRRKRALKKTSIVTGVAAKVVKSVLPYGAG